MLGSGDYILVSLVRLDPHDEGVPPLFGDGSHPSLISVVRLPSLRGGFQDYTCFVPNFEILKIPRYRWFPPLFGAFSQHLPGVYHQSLGPFYHLYHLRSAGWVLSIQNIRHIEIFNLDFHVDRGGKGGFCSTLVTVEKLFYVKPSVGQYLDLR